MIKKVTNLGTKDQWSTCFADDIALIVENKKHLEKIIKTMDETFVRNLSMKINMQKTKILVYRRENNIRVKLMFRVNQIIKQVGMWINLNIPR